MNPYQTNAHTPDEKKFSAYDQAVDLDDGDEEGRSLEREETEGELDELEAAPGTMDPETFPKAGDS